MGLEWLDTLGDVIVNFRESRLIVGSQATRVVLQGDPKIVLWGDCSLIYYEGLARAGSGIFGPIMACC